MRTPMATEMSTELYWLVLISLMTAMLFVPYIVNRMKEHGLGPALWNPQPDTRPKAPWAERLMRAHANAVENLVVFAPLVLALQLVGISTAITAAACVVYFFCSARSCDSLHLRRSAFAHRGIYYRFWLSDGASSDSFAHYLRKKYGYTIQ